VHSPIEQNLRIMLNVSLRHASKGMCLERQLAACDGDVEVEAEGGLCRREGLKTSASSGLFFIGTLSGFEARLLQAHTEDCTAPRETIEAAKTRGKLNRHQPVFGWEQSNSW